MEDSIKRLEEKTDKVLEQIMEIKIDVARHILRTDLAEENMQLIRTDVKPLQDDMMKRMAQAEMMRQRAEQRKQLSAAILKGLSLFVALAGLLFGSKLLH